MESKAGTVKRMLVLTKALGDAQRLRALAALRSGELCLCELVALLRLAPSTVSKHMAVLVHAGLAMPRKAGRWVYYRRAAQGAPPSVIRALAFVDAGLGNDAATARDARALRAIRRADKQELCRCYKQLGRRAGGARRGTS